MTADPNELPVYIILKNGDALTTRELDDIEAGAVLAFGTPECAEKYIARLKPDPAASFAIVRYDYAGLTPRHGRKAVADC